MRRVPVPGARLEIPRFRILTQASPEFGVSSLILGSGNSAVSSWFSTSDPIAWSFRLSEAALVDQLGVFNGSAAGGNFDVAVYDDVAGVPTNRLVSTGSTAGANNNSFQFVDVTNLELKAYTRYWLACCRDNVTANRIRLFPVGENRALRTSGTAGSLTNQFPLPDPIADMGGLGGTAVPIVAMCLRAPF